MLTYDTCLDLLSRGVMGRVAVCTPAGPRIVPVPYAVLGEVIVFEAPLYSVAEVDQWNTRLAFEIDEVDIIGYRGWSIVAAGRGAAVEDPLDVAAIKAAWPPGSWSAGIAMIYVRLPWRELTGRSVGTL